MAKQRIIPIIYKVDYSQVDKSTASVKKAEQATDKLNKEIKETEQGAGKAFTGLKNAIIATGVIGIVTTIAKKIFDIGVAAEQTTIAFNTFLGSASKARLLLADLTKFAIVTPFTPDQVNSAAKALLSFGVQAKQIIPTLKMLGDVSAGTGKDLSEMAIIFGQIRSTGRLMGQDLLQLINAGFNPLQIISEKTGKSMAVLKQEMEKGLISFQMVSDAFKTATSEGGLFFNLMEKQSVSIGGKLSTVAGNIEEVFKNIFSASSGPLADFVDKLMIISEAFLLMSKSADQFAQEIADDRLERFRKKLSDIEDQLKNNNKAIQDNAVSLQNLFAKDVIDALNEVNAERLKLFDDLGKGLITQEDAEMQDKILLAEKNGLIEIRNELFKLTKGTDIQTTAIVKMSEASKKARAEFLKMMGFTTASEKVKAAEKEAQELEKVERDANERSLQLQDYYDDLKRKKDQEQRDYEYEQAEAQAERMRDLQESAFNFGVDLIEGLLFANTDRYDQEEQALRDKYDQETLLAGDNERRKGEIELRRADEEKKLRAKQLEDEKRQNTRRILIETVLNAVKALGLPPIPGANYIAAAKATAYGLLSAGLARRYAKGVIDMDGPGTTTSDSIPAMLSRRESVMTAEETISSKGILKAIRAKKLDDRLIEKLYKGSKTGGDGVAFSDERIVQAIKSNKAPDYKKVGSYIVELKNSNGNHVKHVRSKYIH